MAERPSEFDLVKEAQAIVKSYSSRVEGYDVVKEAEGVVAAYAQRHDRPNVGLNFRWFNRIRVLASLVLMLNLEPVMVLSTQIPDYLIPRSQPPVAVLPSPDRHPFQVVVTPEP